MVGKRTEQVRNNKESRQKTNHEFSSSQISVISLPRWLYSRLDSPTATLEASQKKEIQSAACIHRVAVQVHIFSCLIMSLCVLVCPHQVFVIFLRCIFPLSSYPRQTEMHGAALHMSSPFFLSTLHLHGVRHALLLSFCLPSDFTFTSPWFLYPSVVVKQTINDDDIGKLLV